MYDRYDDTKGRYVTYDYRPKGDRFSRGLSVRPRVWTTIRSYSSGRSSIRRVCTSRARSFSVAQIKAALPPELAAQLEQLTLYFYDAPDGLQISAKAGAKGFPVRFEITEQAKGKRHWFSCIGCSRRVGKLYSVKTQEGNIWGCQKCLGLSYPSQAQHKVPARDMAITEGRISVSWNEKIRAHHRQTQRIMKLSASFERQFGKYRR